MFLRVGLLVLSLCVCAATGQRTGPESAKPFPNCSAPCSCSTDTPKPAWLSTPLAPTPLVQVRMPGVNQTVAISSVLPVRYVYSWYGEQKNYWLDGNRALFFHATFKTTCPAGDLGIAEIVQNLKITNSSAEILSVQWGLGSDLSTRYSRYLSSESIGSACDSPLGNQLPVMCLPCGENGCVVGRAEHGFPICGPMPPSGVCSAPSGPKTLLALLLGFAAVGAVARLHSPSAASILLLALLAALFAVTRASNQQTQSTPSFNSTASTPSNSPSCKLWLEVAIPVTDADTKYSNNCTILSAGGLPLPNGTGLFPVSMQPSTHQWSCADAKYKINYTNCVPAAV